MQPVSRIRGHRQARDVPLGLHRLRAWDVPTAPEQAGVAVTSDIPVLMTSCAFDATAAETLSNSQDLEFAGIGHSASRWSPECFATVLSQFLDNPLEPVDQSCVDALTVAPFVVP